jgi:hypothetical protein
VPLACPRTGPALAARGQELITLAAPLRQQKGLHWSTVSRVDTRAIGSDLTLPTGGTGGPVFAPSGDVVGMTTLPNEREEPRRGEVRIVRIEGACEVIAAATAKMKDASVPSAAHLPVEPTTAAPVAAFKEAVKRRAGSLKPYQIAGAEFDVSFIPPILNYAAQSQPNQNFGNWSDYLADIPNVLLVRVTPKMAEGLWAKVARGAAYTQGMALPAMKRLGAGFKRMRALCNGREVQPIHPLKLELRVSETEAIYEGLYAFDPAAFGPECGTLTLVLSSEKEPEKADTRVVDPGILQQIRRDFDVR